MDWKSERGGITRLNCHSCHAAELEILESLGLGLTDRFDQPLPANSGQPRPHSSAPAANRLGPLPKRLTATAAEPLTLTSPWREVRTYDYVDEAGQLLGQVVRSERTEGTVTQKRFAQRRPDMDGGWVNEASRRRVMRHLPAVAAAIAAGSPVWVAEGEKDDEALNRLLRGVGGSGGVATTNNNGAGGFADEQVEQLRGAHVVLVVDRDPAGYRRALDLSNRLADVAASVRCVLAAVAEAKADAADHIAAGFGLDDFVELTRDHAQTLVDAGTAVREADRADREAAAAQTALDEVSARLEAAAAARKRKATVAAKDEARYAQRWAYQAVRHTKTAAAARDHAQAMASSVQQRVAQFGAPPAELPGADAAARAMEAHARAQRLAQQAWDACGAPMPAEIREVLVRAQPGGHVDHNVLDEPPGAEVFPFPPGGSDGGGGGERRPGSPVRWTEYERLPTGVLVERRYDKDGHEHLVGILSLDARVLQVECLEHEPDEDDRGADDLTPDSRIPDERKVVSYVIGYTHPGTGELITLRVAADRARAGDWLAELPEMGTQYDSSPRGRAKVWDAIRKTSAGAEVVTMYRSTGWRPVNGHGWTYVHAGGGITAGGAIPLPVQLPGTLSRVDLPTPLSDPKALRALFDRDSRALMTRLLPHLGAVLGGTAYRAVLGWTGPTTMVFGVPGSMKSAAAALVMHHFGTRWERTLPSVSMSGQGSTLNAIRDELWAAKDCLFFGDDFAPDKSVDAAATFLAQIARMQYNRERRDRFDARADAVRLGRGSRTTLILTSEVKAATVSGQERLNVIDLAKGQLDLSTIIELDDEASRRGRATVMASMLAWMAKDLPQHRKWAKTRAGEIADRRRQADTDARVAEPLAELEVGWELMGAFLSNIGAYSVDDVEQMLTEVRAALTEAGERSLDPDSPTNLGQRCRQLIASVFRSGAIHLTYTGGHTPEYPSALRYGHRRITLPGVNHEGQDQFRCEARGEWAGVVTRTVHGTRLHVDPTVVLSAILTAARRANEPIQAGRAVVQRELAAAGLLRTETTGMHTRFTCVVPDPTGDGGQTRLWDLDERAIFNEPEPPPTRTPPPVDPVRPGPGDPAEPADQGGSVGPDPYPEATMREFTDTTVHAPADVGPCSACGEPCALYLDGERIHLQCWRNSDPVTPATQHTVISASVEAPCLGCGEPTSTQFGGQPVHTTCSITVNPATAVVAAEPPLQPAPAVAPQTPAPPAAAVTKRPTPRTAPATPWLYSAVVIDPNGIYLPDGTVAAAEPVRTVAAAAAIGERFKIGHPAGAGLVVLTSAMADQLGLLPDTALLTQPLPSGEPATEDDMVDRIRGFLAQQTTFLSNDQGWEADGGKLGPWTRIRKNGRAFRLILEPLVWIWDRRVDSASPFVNLPDADTDPVACWRELARRLERIAELLGVPWSTSPGATGEAIFDQLNRMRARRNGRVLTTAGTLPDVDSTGQVRLEGEYAYRRRPSTTEMAAAVAVHKYDKRGSYLATAGGADLGYGDPEHADTVTAALAVETAKTNRTKMPFGMWLVTLPAWTQPTPPPHPEQRTHEPVRRWITTATLVLLLDDEDAGGAAYTLTELALEQAWIWPEQARFLEPWYTRCRDALLAARHDNDDAVAAAIKGVYTGYIGRMASRYTANGPRPWHHQPVWEATIRALARASLWRAIQRHHLATGRIPVGIDHDEVGYLDDNLDPRVNPPAADNGRLGALKPSGSVALTDQLRRQLAEGASALDKQLEHLPEPAADGA